MIFFFSFFFFGSLDELLIFLGPIEEFALIEASYTTARILQEYSGVHLISAKVQQRTWTGWSTHQTEGIEKISQQRQKVTLVLSLGEGCKVSLTR